jgi:hypothetical protein
MWYRISAATLFPGYNGAAKATIYMINATEHILTPPSKKFTRHPG